ncbi:MAG: DUF86 domain-containing protein [Candidatus Magasanikbacteria bacterium]|nr:DUF86 domain-containing protein [Candidatus Magasanikbacteria bacterium]
MEQTHNSLNPEKLQTRFEEIRNSLTEINTILKHSDAEILEDKIILAALKYQIIIILEAMGSVCIHVCAKKLQKGVTEYAQCFALLSEGNIIEEKLSVELTKMARFRNMVVHQYWKIEESKMIAYLRNNLYVVESFVESISKLL